MDNAKNNSAKKLAIFDMAGTTVNDRDEVYRVLRQSVERQGAEFSDEEFQQWMGTEKRWAITNLLRIGGVTADDALIEESFAWFLNELARTYTEQPPEPLPGVEQALADIRAAGIKIGLTTGFTRDIATLILDRMGWNEGVTIDVLRCGDEVAAGRPAPDLIQAVMAATGVLDPEDVISSGDTEVDIASARAAGVTSVGVLSSHMTADSFESFGADLVVSSIAELVPHLGQPLAPLVSEGAQG